jgi:hypothetical protein
MWVAVCACASGPDVLTTVPIDVPQLTILLIERP